MARKPARRPTRRPRQNGPAGNAISFHFVDGAFVEITGDVDEAYLVEFIDTRNNERVHHAQIRTNHWVRTARQFFTPWQINVFTVKDRRLVFSHRYDGRGKRVYVALESKALGDTLAWFQSLEDFQQLHGCELICSTFMNGLFREQYPGIRFVEPAETVHDLYAMYRVGWFYLPTGEIDTNRNPRNFRQQPLGESAADILGLPYRPVRPRIRSSGSGRPFEEDYVCIAIHSTAQAKYWNNPSGWDDLVAHWRQRGYHVVLLSAEGRDHMGNRAPEGVTLLPPGDLASVAECLRHAKLFVGIGSGLSWLAWAAGCPTCVISGFSYPYTEVGDMIRIAARPGDCSGCFNRLPLDAGDWNWCPDHKNTPRMFECTRHITAADVIAVLDGHLS
jgi:autotransporter strand-loop-strand O-heptosyltransferase